MMGSACSPACRRHSPPPDITRWPSSRETLPAELEVTATTRSGVIMALRHRELPVEAVQFHPESVLTEWGYQMLANWLTVCGDAEAPARAVGMAPLMSAR